MLADCDKAMGETVNIGSNTEISIANTVAIIAELMGKEANVITEEERLRPPKSEVFRLHCDNTKIKQLVSYEPQIDLREGLQRTIDWFSIEGNQKRYKADIYNV